MVPTIEPHYIPPDVGRGPKWWNIGVRIGRHCARHARRLDCLLRGAKEIVDVEKAVEGNSR